MGKGAHGRPLVTRHQTAPLASTQTATSNEPPCKAAGACGPAETIPRENRAAAWECAARRRHASEASAAAQRAEAACLSSLGRYERTTNQKQHTHKRHKGLHRGSFKKDKRQTTRQMRSLRCSRLLDHFFASFVFRGRGRRQRPVGCFRVGFDARAILLSEKKRRVGKRPKKIWTGARESFLSRVSPARAGGRLGTRPAPLSARRALGSRPLSPPRRPRPPPRRLPTCLPLAPPPHAPLHRPPRWLTQQRRPGRDKK